MPVRPRQGTASSNVGGRLGRARLLAGLAALCTHAAGATALADAQFDLRLEAGTEYDSNVHRDERLPGDPAPVGDGLQRILGRSQLILRPTENLQLRLAYSAGGKIFFGTTPTSREEDVFINQGTAALNLRVRPRVVMGVSADYYDAFQRVSLRDFRTLSGAGTVTLFAGESTLTLSGGYRDFTYKPDHTYDFRGDQYGAVFFTRFVSGRATEDEDETEWELNASYFANRRNYAGSIIVNACAATETLGPACLQLRSPLREDLFHEASAGLTYVKSVLLGLTYALQVNDSTSFGQSLRRHAVTARLAVRPLRRLSSRTALSRAFREIYLTLQGTLQFNQFGDPVLIGSQVQAQTFRSIEDENRNSILFGLTRDLGPKGMALEARYSLFTNEFATTPVAFFRQVAYLGLRLDTRLKWAAK